MLKMLARLLFSVTLILSLGYSQVFLAFSLGVSALAETSDSSDHQSSQVDVIPIAHLSGITIQQDAQKQLLDWDSLVLEKDPEEKVDNHSLLLRVALAVVFFFLLSASIGDYQIRFLRFNRHFSYTYPHRLHLFNGVFTI